tara:strand:+ start:1506 stop:2255 length:750 start_codon:yes stop_codon:yes gene_type:complete
LLKSSIARVRWLLFANLALTIFAAAHVSWSALSILAAVSMYVAYNNLGVVIFNHRHLSHGAFEFKCRALRYALALPALLSGAGSSLGWAALHRLHHKHSDTEKDPHQAARGFWRTIFIFYRAEDSDLLRAGIRLARDRFLLLTDRYWLAIILAWVAALSAIGLDALYFGFALPSALTMLAQGATNYFAHGAGYRNHDTDDRSTNHMLLGLLNWGDGIHNNHHANPKAPSTGERWWEVDVAGAVIRAIAK